jgi:uncharacterized protein (TIGR02444 family)
MAAYPRPGVEPACLLLQDAHGQSVAYLLWAAWAASQGRVLPDRVLQVGAGLAARWDAEVLSGLRQARRNMKSSFEGIDDGVRETLRTKVKALELETEKTLMLALEQLAPAGPGPAADPEHALIAATAIWRSPAPVDALRPLARALG